MKQTSLHPIQLAPIQGLVDGIQIGADRQRGLKFNELEAFQTLFFRYPLSWRLTQFNIKLNIIVKAFLSLRWIQVSLVLVLYQEVCF